MGAPGITRLSPSAVLDFREGIGLDRITTSRNTAATAIRASDGAVLDFAANAPRIVPGEGLDVWEATDERVRNAVASGAVAGTPGTPPTSWFVSPNGFTSQNFGVTTVNGVPLLQLEWSGTNVQNTPYVDIEPGNTAITASAGETVTAAFWFQMLSGDIPENVSLTLIAHNAGGVVLGTVNHPIANRSILKLVTGSYPNLPATTAYVRLRLSFSRANNSTLAVPMRFRVGLGNARKASFLAPPVKTSGTAAIVPEDRVNIANIGNFLNLPKGSLVIHARTEIVGFASNRTLFAATVDGNNGLRAIVTSANLLQFLYFIDNVSVGSVIATVPISAGVPFKVAVRWALNDFALTATGMGSSIAKDSSGAVLSAAPVAGRIGRFADSLQPFNGRISRLEIFREPLSDAALLAKVA